MKKTLIALAAVAVSSAAVAQVTISGKLQFDHGVATATTGAKTSTNGFGGGDVRFSVAEDLGAGLKASAYGEIALRGRAAATGTGRNAAITLSGGFGSIMGGSIDSGNGIVGLGLAGAPVIDLTGSSKVLDYGPNVEILTYTLPALVPGLGLSLSTMNVTGSNREALTADQIAATYAVGGLSLAADRTNYKNSNDTAAVSGSCAIAGGTVEALGSSTATCTGGTVIRAYAGAGKGVDNRTRISASYDLGVAKIGYGYQTKSYVTATNKNEVQTVMGVSIPLGAITLGAGSSSSKVDGATTKKTGTDYGISYAVSKRTSLSYAAQSWKTTGAASAKTTRVRMSHSF